MLHFQHVLTIPAVKPAASHQWFKSILRLQTFAVLICVNKFRKQLHKQLLSNKIKDQKCDGTSVFLVIRHQKKLVHFICYGRSCSDKSALGILHVIQMSCLLENLVSSQIKKVALWLCLSLLQMDLTQTLELPSTLFTKCCCPLLKNQECIYTYSGYCDGIQIGVLPTNPGKFGRQEEG